MGCNQGKQINQNTLKPIKANSIKLQKNQSNTSSKTQDTNKISRIHSPKQESFQQQSESPNGSTAFIRFNKTNTNKKTFQIDDQDIINEKGGIFQKIHAVKVAYTSQYIEGIQMAYEVTNGNIITGNDYCSQEIQKKNSYSQNQNESYSDDNSQNEVCIEDVYEVPVDDYITQIVGNFDQKLKSIQFITYKGQQSKIFGCSCNKNQFNLKMDGYSFGPIKSKYNQKQILLQLELPFNLIDSDLSEKDVVQY